MKSDRLTLIVQDLTPTRILLLIVLLGFWIRIFFVLSTDFPLNDGGMFMTMVEDLQRNHFLLPAYTSYNVSHIPYAYPPLPFYIAGAISSILHIPVLTILHILPAIISTLTIPAFYGIALCIFRKQKMALLATTIFSLLPKSYEWFIMGGGLTRSFGFFFALIAIWVIGKAYLKSSVSYTIIAGVFLGLSLLSHMEMSLFALYSMALITLYLDKSIHGLMRLGIAYTVGLCVALPWIITIIRIHGLTPFESAMHTGFWSYYSLLPLVLFNITSEPFLNIFAVFGLLGTIGSLITSTYILPLWLVCVFVINQRSPQNMGTVPFALLIAVGLYMFLWQPLKQYLSGATRKLTITILIIVWNIYLLSMIIALMYPSYSSLQAISFEQRQAMTWVKQNIPKRSSFLVMTSIPASAWYVEREAEWFPALTQHKSPLTIQGTEWLPKRAFNEIYKQRKDWKLCNNEDVSCLEKTAQKYNITYDYIYLDTYISYNTAPCCALLEKSLKASVRYKKIYDKENISIWMKKIHQ